MGSNSTFDSVSNPLLYGGDADSFNVPNLNNRFMRGYKDGDATVQLRPNILKKRLI